MKPTTKNKIVLFIYIVTLGLLVFLTIDQVKGSWGKSAFILLSVFTVVLAIINSNRIKYFTLLEDRLIISQTFSKQKQISLKTVIDWNENQYELFGTKTKREIVLKTFDGKKINLFEKNSKDYEMLSDYLNKNIS
ncbi:hypothetical protein ACQ9BO_10575 [Flavobacterium sp. P21]|uniref:hypothetical protein n=1 Tax=Flavobacterium sp. P21 TaxID=3423948 RepID=UPI003D676D0F